MKVLVLICSDSVKPQGLQPSRLLCPWDFPGKNTGVGCYFLLQETFLNQGSNPGLQHCRQILYCLSQCPHSQWHKEANSDVLNPRSVVILFCSTFLIPRNRQEESRLTSIDAGQETLKDRNNVLTTSVCSLSQPWHRAGVLFLCIQWMKINTQQGEKQRIKLREGWGHWPDPPPISCDLYWASFSNHTKLSPFSSCLVQSSANCFVFWRTETILFTNHLF